MEQYPNRNECHIQNDVQIENEYQNQDDVQTVSEYYNTKTQSPKYWQLVVDLVQDKLRI